MVSFIKSVTGLAMAVAFVAVSVGAVGVTVSPLLAALVLGGVIALAYGVSQEDEFSVTFAVTLVAALIIIVQLLPPMIQSRLPYAEQLTSIDAVSLLVGVAVFVLFWWVIDVRFLTGSAKKPETVAKRLRKRTEKLADSYAGIVRVAVVGVITVAVVFASQIASGFGELGAVAAEVPWVASNLAMAAWGYLAVGGTIPIVGGFEISRGLFALVAITLIVAALAADNA